MKVFLKVIILFSFCLSWALSLDTLWIRRYDSGKDDEVSSIAVDKAGNIIVAGGINVGDPCDWDYCTIKYAPDGDIIWACQYDAGINDKIMDITVDNENNIYVVGRSVSREDTSLDYLIVKYAPNGDTIWTLRYNSGEEVSANDIEIDSSGHIIIGGSTTDYPHNDIEIIKLDPGRKPVWVKRYDGSGYDDWIHGMAIDNRGNIFVTGISNNGDHYDCLVIKYNADGDTIWTRRYNTSGDEVGADITLNGQENIIVAGSIEKGSSPPDVLVIQYDPKGDTLWTRQYGGSGGDAGLSVVTDIFDNVYVGGAYEAVTGDYIILKYDADGNFLWEERYESGYNESVRGIALGPSGNIVITGQSYNNRQNYDYLTINYVPETGVSEERKPQNQVFRVLTNPSHDDIVIQYSIAKGSDLVNLAIYDISGKLVRTISNTPSVYSSITWDGRDDEGKILPSGIYFCEFRAGTQKVVKKMVLLR